jgi:hypothetical protein
MRYFVFDSRVAARFLIRKINERMLTLFAARGYTVTANGIVGKWVSDQTDNPTDLTTTWTEERQRLDGKWVVLHPEKHPLRFRTAADRDGDIAELIRDRVSDFIEEEQPGWFE